MPALETYRVQWPEIRADFTVDQKWDSYLPAEHDRWRGLFERQRKLLDGRACKEFVDGLRQLEIDPGQIPDFSRLSDALSRLTRWSVVPVPGLVPDDVFFDHLANRRFPAGCFIRRADQLDYIEEPDVFHDVFGHVPMLAHPVFADYLEAYGKGGRRALALNKLPNLARLYWYTVEFGLIQNAEGLRIYGSGIVSSATESIYALESTSPNRLHFDLERVMRTKYRIDDFQETYFVVTSFDELFETTYQDFAGLYERLSRGPAYEPGTVLPTDRIHNKGDRHYVAGSHAAV